LHNFLIILLFLATLIKADDEYNLGEGIQVGSLPLYIGGYFSIDYKGADDEDTYRLDDIAILGYGSYNKFSYIAELEFKEFYVKKNSPDSHETSQDRKLYIERLYIDYDFNENYMFRVGKYNSPVGFWNLFPINVLKETTSNPISPSIIYPSFTTGLGISYSTYDSGELKIEAMLQNNKDFNSEYNNYKSDKHYGFGLSYEKDNYAIKINGGYFHKNDNKIIRDNLYYILASAKYETDDYQVLSEIGRQRSKEDITTNHAGYIQGLYRFTQHHIGIIRIESYETNAKKHLNDELIVLGYTYRPLYPIAIKSEYQFYSNSKLNQILLSISVLF